MTAWASHAGRIVAAEQLLVPVTDRGLLLGDGVFETLRTYDGRLFALEDHLDRLWASMTAIGLVDPPARPEIAAWARALVAHARRDGGEWVVRITVTRGSGGHGVSPRGAGPPQVYLLARPLAPAPAQTYTRGLSVVTARTRRVAPSAQDPRIKATSALSLVLARQEADAAGADEALLCDGQGRYLEASSANLFVVSGRRFFTPRGPDGVLEGVTWRRVLPLLEEEGLSPVWGPVPASVLRAADEVLLTQTTRAVIPVVRVDDRPVGAGRPGPVGAAVRARFDAVRGRWLDP